MRLTKLVLLVAGLGVLAGCDDGTAPAPAVTSSTMRTPVTQEGIFEYTVTSFGCSKKSVGDAVPRGRFCTVGITVHNISGAGRKPGIAFAKAYDGGGTAYLADAVAQIRARSALLDDLGAGATIKDRLIYDVPAGVTITSVVLRETASASGISVAVS
jgi:uncharacterized protein DUF4352